MRVLFADGTAGFKPNKLESEPTGGICTSLTLIPRHLASKGHEVYIKSEYDTTEVVEGVRFLDRKTPSPPVDVVVLNRNMPTYELLSQVSAMGVRCVWWLHDMVDHNTMSDSAFYKVKNIVALSKYQVETYADFYGLSNDKFTVIPNGVDRSVWYPGDYEKRDPNLFVFASAPVKGFRPLGFAMSNLKRHLPGLDFRIYSSQKLHKLEDDVFIKKWLEVMTAIGAKVSEPIPQKELAEVLRKAWCLVMPNDYPEMHSNLLLQAQACGCPVVASPVGGIPEAIKHGETGIMTKWVPHDRYMWWMDFARCVAGIAKNKEIHKKISEQGQAVPMGWDKVGDMWEEYLNKCL